MRYREEYKREETIIFYLTPPRFVIVAAGLHDWMSPKGMWRDTERVRGKDPSKGRRDEYRE